MHRWCAILALAVACGGSGAPVDDPPDGLPPAPPGRVIIFTRTQAFRHVEAIAACQATLPAALEAVGLTSVVTEDLTLFHDLSSVSAVVFAYNTGDKVLDADGKVELERYIRAGGGWIGIHGAISAELSWPFYDEIVVTRFLNHPSPQPAVIGIEDATHPAMAVLPGQWSATDEWFNFKSNPREPGVDILATIDEATYTGGVMGADHPMIWSHERLGGRVLYTEPGHLAARWSEPAYVDHVVAAVRWVAHIAD